MSMSVERLWKSEAAIWKCSIRKVFWKILQVSQEEILQSYKDRQPAILSKRDKDVSFFLWIWQNFQIIFFYKTSLTNDIRASTLGHSTTHFGQFFLFYLFFISSLYETLLSLYTTYMVQFIMLLYVQLLTLNDSMSYYCFSHYFNGISVITVIKQ